MQLGKEVINFDKMIQECEMYLYERYKRKVNITFNHPLRFPSHFTMLSELHQQARIWYNKNKQ